MNIIIFMALSAINTNKIPIILTRISINIVKFK